MDWTLLTIINVLGNGTALFLLKKALDKSLDYIETTLSLFVVTFFVIAPFFFIGFLKNPVLFSHPAGFIYYLTASTIGVFGYIFYAKALASNDLSIVGPLDNLRPFFVVIFSIIILGQFPKNNQIIGILLIIIGAFVLKFQTNIKSFFESVFRSKASLYILITTALFALSSIFDKKSLAYINPLSYTFLIFAGQSIIFGLITLKKSKKINAKIFLNPKILFAGLCFGFGSIALMTAFQKASPNVVVPVQMTRSLYLAFLGIFLLREKGLLKKALATIIMLAGVCFIVK